MNDSVLTINDIHHPNAAKQTGVVRLSARCRIERGAVENDSGVGAVVIDYGGVKLKRVGVVIEPDGHLFRPVPFTTTSSPTSIRPVLRGTTFWPKIAPKGLRVLNPARVLSGS